MRVRGMLIALFGALFLLTSCGGNSTPATTTTPNASNSAVSLTVSDAPPAGVAVLSFEVTVNSATLEPGDVPVVTSPIRIEVTKLETETAFLNTAGVAPGNYTGINVTFANPELTFLNKSGAAIGSCADGSVCEIKPPLTNASVSYNAAPFPLTLSAGSPMGFLVDFDLQNSIQSSLSVAPVIKVTQLPAVQATGHMDDIDEVVGQVTAKDAANNQLTLQVGGSGGKSIVVKVDATTKFDDFEEESLASGFAAVAVGQVLKVDLKLMGDGSLLAKDIELAEKEQIGELEGEITSVGSNQFQMVVVDESPDIPGVQVGNPITVNIQSGATFAINWQSLTAAGVSFAGPSDLMVGQHVQIRPTAPPSGTPLTVSTDRIRLRNTRLTAQVAAINGSTITLDTLPAIFTSASPAISQIQVMVVSHTEFDNASGLSSLSTGNTISVSGLLFDTAGTPTLVAKKIRKR